MLIITNLQLEIEIDPKEHRKVYILNLHTSYSKLINDIIPIKEFIYKKKKTKKTKQKTKCRVPYQVISLFFLFYFLSAFLIAHVLVMFKTIIKLDYLER